MTSDHDLRAPRFAPLYLPLALLASLAFSAGCAGDPPTCLGAQCEKGGDGDGDGETSLEAPTPAPSDKPEDDANDDPIDDQGNGPTASEDPDNTFEHPSDLDGTTRDPFDILAQREEEGPPEVRTRLHSCQKVTVTALRNILTSLGVDLEREAGGGEPPSAGQLLAGGNNALGASNYGARSPEALVWTAAGAAKTFDIFVQAAPEIIANLPNQPQCQVDGVGPSVFDEAGSCNQDALSCMMGVLATEEHVAICNSAVASASDLAKGQAIAVATVLSAAHSCE